MKKKNYNITCFSEPTTEKQLLHNILYYQEELDFMDGLQLIKLDTVPSIPNGGSINWRFLQKSIPKLNAFFQELWDEEKKDREFKIHQLKEKYNKL